MCGRFTHLYTWTDLHRLMRLTTAPDGPEARQLPLRPSYNVAPTQLVTIVRQSPSRDPSATPSSPAPRAASAAKWGLVPFWAKDPGIGSRLINARCEDAAIKPAFRAAMKQRRCLVPASGFYEWQTLEGSKRKQPWYFTVSGAPLFAFAGLWESWTDPASPSPGSEAPLQTFTLLTGAPNSLVAPIHNRMPVIVSPDLYSFWLDPAVTSAAALAPCLRPYPANLMEARPVSTRVNSPANNDPSLLDPAA